MERGRSMDSAWAVIIVGALTLIGTIITVSVGNTSTRKMLSYRMEQVEKKMDKHNCLIERMYKVEERCSISENEIKVANHRLSDLEKEA